MEVDELWPSFVRPYAKEVYDWERDIFFVFQVFELFCCRFWHSYLMILEQRKKIRVVQFNYIMGKKLYIGLYSYSSR